MRYLEFAAASNFSFLRGASHPEELMGQAAHLGLAGLGLCDRNSVAGVVRAHVAKREHKMALRYHPGARLVFADGSPDILAYPRDRPAWGRLTRLLSVGNLRAEKGDCILYCEDLLDHIEGLELVVMGESSGAASSVSSFRASGRRPRDPESIIPAGGYGFRARTFGASRNDNHVDRRARLLSRLRDAAPGRVRLVASMLYRGDDRARLAHSADLARQAGVPLIAVNDVFFHHSDRRPLADVLTCIREHVTIDQAGRRLAVNAERYLKPAEEMARLFRDAPEAIAETLRLDAALTFSLDELCYEYPDESMVGFATPQEAMEHLTWEGAKERYPEGISEKVRESILNEFALIAQCNYAPYFLTVYDIVRFARSRGILCQGRGSAANSTVCYCLGITSVDPVRGELLFERFISVERREPPDIDVDFEHERREEVIQYIYEKYGRARAGIAATVISYRGRSAIREVGKAFGLSEDMIGALSSSIWGMGGGSVRAAELKRAGIDVEAPRIKRMCALVQEIQAFPRHLSQHVGGFVITRGRLDEVVPIMNGAMEDRTHVEWDKDDLDALNILKVDVLGLGMLTCIRKALELMGKHYAEANLASCSGSGAAPHPGHKTEARFDLTSIPPEDPAVYRMLQRADSLGVFQVESRAQMTMLPRLKPQNFYDLVVEVAIVRPGPIQGDMVHPYLRRRQGLEPVSYPSPELQQVLGKTLGVPLFQEQAMKIAIVAAGFTPGEADRLRRAMATFRRVGTIGTFQRKMVEGMVARGYEREFAERCFHQIEGFGEYGFPESHAASFALLVYASAWLKCRYPDVFAAALLNAQPMGFYATAQIVRDSREHGVEVRPPDINHSDWDSTLEPGPRAAERLHPLHREMEGDIRSQCAIRLGLREIKGLSEEDGKLIVTMRSRREAKPSYDSLRDIWLRTRLAPKVLERLADADAFGSLGLSRRDALWAAKALGRVGDRDDDLPLFRTNALPLAKGGSLSSCGGGSTPAHAPRGACEPDVALPPMPLGEEVVNDYRFLHLSLRAHPASFLRPDLNVRGVAPNQTLRERASDTRVTVSGLVTCRQRPGSAKGVIFMTIEDETSFANIIVWPKIFERFRPTVLGARYVLVTGKLQEESGVLHVVADRIEDLTFLLGRLAEHGADLDSLARCDEVRRPTDDHRDKRLRPGRTSPLVKLLNEMPELVADLDVPARGSAHAPGRRSR